MDEPDSLFRKSMAGVTPLHAQDPTNVPNTPKSDKTSCEIMLIAKPGKVDLDGDLFYRSGIQKKRLRELRRGRLKIADILDLHGYTRMSTPTAVIDFLADCDHPNLHCVMIITGKGRNSPDRKSVVRAVTLETLRNHPRVLAYCCAQPADGGHGSFYVLLQR